MKRILFVSVLFCLVIFISACATAAIIDFDDIVSPYLFISTTALTELYAPLGVHFTGTGQLNGGAILNDASLFGVSAHSGTNFLAFNAKATMNDGGRTIGPETITFDEPVANFSMFVATNRANVSAYDTNGLLVDTTSGGDHSWSQISISSASGIKSVKFEYGDIGTLVVDDIAFEVLSGQNNNNGPIAVPEPATLLGFGLPMLMVGLAKLRRLRK